MIVVNQHCISLNSLYNFDIARGVFFCFDLFTTFFFSFLAKLVCWFFKCECFHLNYYKSHPPNVIPFVSIHCQICLFLIRSVHTNYWINFIFFFAFIFRCFSLVLMIIRHTHLILFNESVPPFSFTIIFPFFFSIVLVLFFRLFSICFLSKFNFFESHFF